MSTSSSSKNSLSKNCDNTHNLAIIINQSFIYFAINQYQLYQNNLIQQTCMMLWYAMVYKKHIPFALKQATILYK